MSISFIVKRIQNLDKNNGIDTFINLFTLFYKPDNGELNNVLYDYLKFHITPEVFNLYSKRLITAIINVLNSVPDFNIDKFKELKTFDNLNFHINKENLNIYKVAFILKFLGYVKTFKVEKGYICPDFKYPKVFGLELFYVKHPEFLTNNIKGIEIFLNKLNSICSMLENDNINLLITSDYSHFHKQNNSIEPIFKFSNQGLKREKYDRDELFININAGDPKINGGFMDVGSKIEESMVINYPYLILLTGIFNVEFDNKKDFLNVIDLNKNEAIVYVNACNNKRIKKNNIIYYDKEQFKNIDVEYNKLYRAFASLVSNTKNNKYHDGIINMINWGLGYFNGLFILKLYTFLKVIKNFNFYMINWNVYNDKNILNQLEFLTVYKNDNKDMFYDWSIKDITIKEIINNANYLIPEQFTQEDLIKPFKNFIITSTATRALRVKLELRNQNSEWTAEYKDNKIIYYRYIDNHYINFIKPPSLIIPKNYGLIFMIDRYMLIDLSNHYIYNIGEIVNPQF